MKLFIRSVPSDQESLLQLSQEFATVLAVPSNVTNSMVVLELENEDKLQEALDLVRNPGDLESFGILSISPSHIY